jgi:hypothetical protein
LETILLYTISGNTMKALFSILCLVSLMGPLAAADLFLGERISAASNTSSDEVFNAMLLTWTQDIQHARKNGELCVCSNADITAARQAVNDTVFAARRAYVAQMEFARYSLEPLCESMPQRRDAALQQFGQALLVLLQSDMQQLRLRSVLCDAALHPEMQPREDAFAVALTNRFATAPTMRSDMAELQTFLNQQHQRKVDFVTSLLAGDRPTTEFLTNTRLENAPEDYAATCQAKFRTACAAWQQYMDAAARLHSPIPSLQGGSTPAATEACRQILQCQFEDLLTLLAEGLGK